MDSSDKISAKNCKLLSHFPVLMWEELKNKFTFTIKTSYQWFGYPSDCIALCKWTCGYRKIWKSCEYKSQPFEKWPVGYFKVKLLLKKKITFSKKKIIITFSEETQETCYLVIELISQKNEKKNNALSENLIIPAYNYIVRKCWQVWEIEKIPYNTIW